MATDLGFWRLAEQAPDHVAVVGPDGREVTAGALLAQTNRLVHGLRARGLRRGDIRPPRGLSQLDPSR